MSGTKMVLFARLNLGMTPIPKHLSKIKMVATDYLLRVVALYLVLDNEAIL